MPLKVKPDIYYNYIFVWFNQVYAKGAIRIIALQMLERKKNYCAPDAGAQEELLRLLLERKKNYCE
jgi:hypothetical protein